jgi:energy-coupling factor transporter ATP-binding protein EcfA2
MFEHLKVFNHKGLKECVLLDLGKINVICGRNNSGKTTLVEAINDSSNRDFGKRFDKETARQIYLQIESQWRKGPDAGGSSRYVEFLQTLLEDRVWYSGDVQAFTTELAKLLSQDLILKRYPFGSGLIQPVYTSLFPDPPSTVLIPPKRSIELRPTIQTNSNVVPEGRGVTNRVFHLKNQPEGSGEWHLYTRMCEAFKEVSSGYSFGITTVDINQIALQFSHKDQSWISAEDSGLGLQDLLLILYFALAPDYDVILLEEPESHMHPDMQRRLIHFLHDETSKQFFITTHSNIFLNSAFVDRVFFTRFDDSVKVDDATSRASILHDIGYEVVDNLISDLVILTEGPTDIPALEEFLVKWNLFGTYNIKIWPLGGDIMDQVDLSVFAQNYSIIGLVDNDPGSAKVRKRFIANCEEHGIEVKRLKRYALENYFSLRALRKVFGSQILPEVSDIEPSTRLEEQIGVNVKKNNRKIAREMTKDEIEGTDLGEFLNRVEDLCKQHAPGKLG